MRGGGPDSVQARCAYPRSSPHARGWSLVKSTPPSTSPVFPACAGVVPHQPQQRRHARRLPRMRGGGPKKPSYLAMMDMSSPHARGWSQEAQLPRDDGHVFPACAGVVPRERRTAMSKWSLPRMRGGGPPRQPPQTNPTKSSPHARGWSFSFSSASLARSVFPACAGVVPHNRRSPRPRHSLPRMRGGGPRPPDLRAVRGSSSPHARGWSAGDVCDFVDGEVFPACAGVVRMSSRRTRSRSGLPRMRGGGPQPVAATITPPMSSPHARGWSPPP